MRRWLPGAMAIVALVTALRAASGCSVEPGAAPLDAGGEGSADSSRLRDSGRDVTVDAKPIPGELEGWQRWDDYDPKCNFLIPSDPKYLPEPFEWEPCQDTEVTRKLSCRRIKKKWEGIGREFIGPATTVHKSDSGDLLITTVRYEGPRRTYLVGSVDGPTLAAISLAAVGECLIDAWSGAGSRYLFGVAERSADGSWQTPPAAVGGSIHEARPRLLFRKPPSGDIVTNTLAAGDLGFINNGKGLIEVYSWESPPKVVRTLQGNGRYSFVEVRDDFFFYAADRASSTERIWTPEGGDQHFLGDGADFSRGTADLNTDGVDWVWAEGEGRTTGAFPIVKVVTSPFTRDPAKIQRRVLRSDIGQGMIAASRFAVGHGYAGHISQRANGDLGAMVVRLADGAGWFLPGVRGAPVIFQHVLAITKDEAFTLVRDEHGTNVYRVRLDSLGAFALPPAL